MPLYVVALCGGEKRKGSKKIATNVNKDEPGMKSKQRNTDVNNVKEMMVNSRNRRLE